jgi:hypothetical protein
MDAMECYAQVLYNSSTAQMMRLASRKVKILPKFITRLSNTVENAGKKS